MDLKEEALLGDVQNHWYYKAKLVALQQAMNGLQPCVVLDVGAGAGFFARSLLQAGRATKAICVDPGYPQDRNEIVEGRQMLFRRALDANDARDVGLVLMMDVLEHVEDDVALARLYVDQVASGTTVIVTVPAFTWLWSGHDVFLEHHRRYTLGRLTTVLQAARLRMQFGSYYYGAILPMVAGVRLLNRLVRRSDEPKSDMREFGPVLNSLLWNLCRFELPMFRANRLGGLSVFARAVKP